MRRARGTGLRAGLARGPARRHPHDHLHVGHDRPAEGRPAHPREPAGGRGRGGEAARLPGRRRRVISWLPSAHVAERTAHHYLPIVYGMTITTCPDPRRIGEFLPAVRPTWFFAVPRVWEKLKAGVGGQAGRATEEAQQLIAAAKARSSSSRPASRRPRPCRAPAEATKLSRATAPRDRARRSEAGQRRRRARRRARCSCSSTPSASRSRRSGACRRPAARARPTRRTRSRSAPSARPSPGVELKLAEDGELLVPLARRDARVSQPAARRPRRSTTTAGSHTGDVGDDRRGRLRHDRRPQEGADHQRGRQEHVAGEHRGDPERLPRR